ncbi:MAG: GerMN domain-containing protein [Patescibacteria group bacterium]|nr:GerMN domain-containing protein [Patescibacteria group bacterium]
MNKNKKALTIMIAVIAVLALWFFIRFFIGGPEDDWICVDGEWVKHGNPTAPMPTVLCDEKPQTEKSVKLYYYNPDLDKDEFGNIACSRNGLVSVERRIPISKTPIQDAIKLLITGRLTKEEKSQGITTEYPLEGFSLKGVSLKDGILTLEFEDFNYKTGGGSCRVGILWFQVEATAKQFSEVQQVRFLPGELFQP